MGGGEITLAPMGVPRSQVCECLTICSAPPSTLVNFFPLHMCVRGRGKYLHMCLSGGGERVSECSLF